MGSNIAMMIQPIAIPRWLLNAYFLRKRYQYVLSELGSSAHYIIGSQLFSRKTHYIVDVAASPCRNSEARRPSRLVIPSRSQTQCVTGCFVFIVRLLICSGAMQWCCLDLGGTFFMYNNYAAVFVRHQGVPAVINGNPELEIQVRRNRIPPQYLDG